MEDSDDAPEAAAVKAWLADLLQSSGFSKAALARELKVEPKTIYNAFGEGSKLPRGLTFYRLLRALDALRDPPGDAGQSLFDRLEALEAKVETQGEATTKAVDALARDVRALTRELKLRGGLTKEMPG